MPLSYDVDAAARLVVLTCGDTSLERWRAVMLEVLADPHYQPDYAVLVDCRTATRTPSTEDVRAVVGFIVSRRALLGRARWAVVVERDAGFGMARMAGAVADANDVDLKAFRTIDDAMAWLTAGSESEGG